MAFYGALGQHPGGPAHPSTTRVFGLQAYPITGGLWPGRMIRITGMPTPTANRFSVNFQTSDDLRRAEIALMMDVRFLWGGDCMAVVRNTRLEGIWQIPDRYTPFFPLLPGAYFELIIFIEPHCFRILVNNQPWFEYAHENHGFPLYVLTCLWIAGDVMLHHVQIT